MTLLQFKKVRKRDCLVELSKLSRAVLQHLEAQVFTFFRNCEVLLLINFSTRLSEQPWLDHFDLVV